jgi:hypothetical protein
VLVEVLLDLEFVVGGRVWPGTLVHRDAANAEAVCALGE